MTATTCEPMVTTGRLDRWPFSLFAAAGSCLIGLLGEIAPVADRHALVGQYVAVGFQDEQAVTCLFHLVRR